MASWRNGSAYDSRSTKTRAGQDEVAWDKNEEDSEQSQRKLRREQTCRLVKDLVERTFEERAKLVPPLIIGGFSILYRFEFKRQEAQFPEEKTHQETATGRFLHQTTDVPPPQVLHRGCDEKLGSYLIIQNVDNRRDMCDALAIPTEDFSLTSIPNPGLSRSELKNFVSGHPVTQNMNTMLPLANIPQSVLSKQHKTFHTADEWYVALAEMHMAQLVFQHNDLVASEDDCRNKYVARQLFRRLAKEGKLSTCGFASDKWSAFSIAYRMRASAFDGDGSFRLWWDDFRPVNVLLDESDEITAVIDWEFTYAAPAQFTQNPPWWILLETPEVWKTGLEGWLRDYEPHFDMFLQAMEEQEAGIDRPQGTFTRRSWAFDAMFWTYLDESFYGKANYNIPEEQRWWNRLQVLTHEEQDAMEPFVKRKMEESIQRVLVEWSETEAVMRLSEILFDSRQSQRAERDLVIRHSRQVHIVHGRVVRRAGGVAGMKALEQRLALGARLLLLRHGALLAVAAVGPRGHEQAAALLGAVVAGAAHGRAALTAADALLGGGLDLLRGGAGQQGRERAVGEVGRGAADVGRGGRGEQGAEEGGDAE
ncbi:hypothetical protein PspLS_04075 [Pyricularia sp. CBS 133598]|nr:hypothetical protein PspLS_04075 [Pyricularia sp. CBS 133598]